MSTVEWRETNSDTLLYVHVSSGRILGEVYFTSGPNYYWAVIHVPMGQQRLHVSPTLNQEDAKRAVEQAWGWIR